MPLNPIRILMVAKFLSPAETLSLKSCFVYTQLPVQIPIWMSTRHFNCNMSSTDLLIFPFKMCSPCSFSLQSMVAPFFQLLGQKTLALSLTVLFLLNTISNLSANPTSSVFTIDSEGAHCSPPPLLPLWFKNTWITTQVIILTSRPISLLPSLFQPSQSKLF